MIDALQINLGQMATMGIRGDFAAKVNLTVPDKSSRLAAPAKSPVFEQKEHAGGSAVVQFSDIDILGSKPRSLVQLVRSDSMTGRADVGGQLGINACRCPSGNVCGGDRVNEHGLDIKISGSLGAHHYNGCGAIVFLTAVEHSQRVGDHSR